MIRLRVRGENPFANSTLRPRYSLAGCFRIHTHVPGETRAPTVRRNEITQDADRDAVLHSAGLRGRRHAVKGAAEEAPEGAALDRIERDVKRMVLLRTRSRGGDVLSQE